jgi:hypothetical protein
MRISGRAHHRHQRNLLRVLVAAAIGVVMWQSVGLGYSVEQGACLAPGMSVAQRADQRGLVVADYELLRELTTIDAATYCAIDDAALAQAVRVAYTMQAAERRSGAGGLWLRFEHWSARVVARLGLS